MDDLDLALEEGGFDAYVAFGNSQDANILYLTRFSVTDPILYIRRRGERGVIIVPQMECERAAKETDAVVISRAEAGYFEISKEERDPWRVLARVIERQVPAGPVLVPPSFPYALGSELARERQVGVDRDTVHRMREVKTAQEIRSIRHVQHVCDRAMERALLVIRKAKARKGLLFQGAVPLTSSLVRSAIHQVLVRNGCIPGETIVSCGEETAMPHRRGDGQLMEGEPIVIDIFPRDQETGYFTDMTRTVCRGEASPEIADMFRAVRGAQDLASRLIRPGVSGAEVYQAAVDFFREAGYESGSRGFVHSLGHGVGLEVHELPGLGPSGGELKANSVVTNEPGLYYPGTGGVRLENTGVVGQSGFSSLTRFGRDLVL